MGCSGTRDHRWRPIRHGGVGDNRASGAIGAVGSPAFGGFARRGPLGASGTRPACSGRHRRTGGGRAAAGRVGAGRDKPTPEPTEPFSWPVIGEVLSDFGQKPDGSHNDGVNIAAPRGAPVRAARGGEIAYAGNELRGYGNLLLLRHPDGYITAYAHLDRILVQRGDQVEQGFRSPRWAAPVP